MGQMLGLYPTLLKDISIDELRLHEPEATTTYFAL